MRSVIFIENVPSGFEINSIFGSPDYSMFEFCVMIETLGDDFFKTLATTFPKLAGNLETHPENSDIYSCGQSPSRFPGKSDLPPQVLIETNPSPIIHFFR